MDGDEAGTLTLPIHGARSPQVMARQRAPCPAWTAAAWIGPVVPLSGDPEPPRLPAMISAAMETAVS